MKEQLIINGQGDIKDVVQSALISHPDVNFSFSIVNKL
jgi:hypothetical protein